MPKILKYFSLGAAVLSSAGVLGQTYDEDNRAVTPPEASLTYYDTDITEPNNYATNPNGRVPGWMTKAPYSDLIEDKVDNTDQNNVKTWKVQKTGPIGSTTAKWASPNQAVALDMTDQAHKDFLAAVKAEIGSTDAPYTRGGGVRDTTSLATVKDTWEHIRQWWYRDGYLFGLILDDRANKMIHNDDWQQFQDDVIIGQQKAANNQLKYYKIRPEQHHMEHLRKFCNYAGGTLWAPSSQAEYDDIMEREKGVCHKHDQTYDDGKSLDTNSKIEIYLNLHREGYLKCVDTYDNQKSFTPVVNNNPVTGAGGVGLETKEACPTAYQNSRLSAVNPGTTAKRSSASDYSNRDEFFTTDHWFADDIDADGLCSNNYEQVFLYSKFRTVSNIPSTCEQTDKPYLHPTCFEDKGHRFQKFVQQDVSILNKFMSNDDFTDKHFNDCVVTTCNDVGSTGPNSDTRYISEWNLNACNQHRHVGICRIRAHGCNKKEWECANLNDKAYSLSCGKRQFLRSVSAAWAGNDVENKATASAYRTQIVPDTDPAGPLTSDVAAILTSQIEFKFLAEDLTQTSADFDNWYSSLDSTYGANEWQIANGKGAKPATVDFGVFSGTVKTACVCDCNDIDGRNAPNENTADCDSTTGSKFPLTPVTSNLFKAIGGTCDQTTPNAIGKQVTFNCEDNLPQGNSNTDVCECYSGSVSATCELRANGYEASYAQPTLSCVNSCCTTSIFANKADTSVTNPDGYKVIDNRPAARKDGSCSWKPGDTYTVECNGADYYISGTPNKDKSKTYTIPSGADLDACFTPPVCVSDPCGCPEKENGFCNFYSANNVFSQTDNNRNPGEYFNGDSFRCRCNKGFVNIRSGSTAGATPNTLDRRPYDTVTCNGKAVWKDSQTPVDDPKVGPYGVCVPLKCANPPDLVVNGQVVGLPKATAIASSDRGSAKSSLAATDNCIEYQCAKGWKPVNGVAPKSCCNETPNPDSNDPEGDNRGYLGFYSTIVGSCEKVVEVSECDQIPAGFVKNAWEPVYHPKDVTLSSAQNNCHQTRNGAGVVTDPFKVKALIDLNKDIAADATKKLPEGTRATFECYTEYRAYKVADYIKKTKGFAEDQYCGRTEDSHFIAADGSKSNISPNDNQVDLLTPCREDTTAARIAANTDPNAPVALSDSNDKVVAICEKGKWQTVSHECLCKEQLKDLWGPKDYFTFNNCALLNSALAAKGGVVSGGSGKSIAPPPQAVLSGFTNKMVLTTCGMLPAVFYNL